MIKIMMLLSIYRRVKSSIFPERTAFFAAACTQYLTDEEVQKAPYLLSLDDEKSSHIDDQEFSVPSDTSSFKKQNAFDMITIYAGSSITFFVILSVIAGWALWGIFDGITDTWQIIFQNASSIQVYIIDILLIRQQQNSSRALITRLAEFNSRHSTFERLLAQIPESNRASDDKNGPRKLMVNSKPIYPMIDESEFMAKEKNYILYAWAQSCKVIARGLGSMYSFFLYWVGIGVWIALGPSFQFSDTWQLYINTATALLLTLTSVFLQNIQQREEERLTRYLEYTHTIDTQIEQRLRLLTGDQRPNPLFTIPEPHRTRSERVSDFLADVMGSGLGVLISIIFIAIWVSIGPLLKFNDNWWLIIGSFTGLVGFIDGFVLRSLYYREENFLKEQLGKMALVDRFLFDQLNLPAATSEERKRNITEKISLAISNTCGHRYAPLGAIIMVFALLILASAMLWSMTGQLLCNTLTMIIEGFLLIVLIHAHNYANTERGTEFSGLLKRKLALMGFVEMLH